VMSDLQCPATIVLIARESIASGGGSEILEGRHVAGAFVASAAAAGLAGGRTSRLSTLPDVADGASLARAIEDLADLHRGETIAVVATRDMIQDMLGDAGVRADSITIAVDDSGWVVSPGGRQA
jgi:hypothetical protein